MSNDYIFETEEEIRERIARNLEDESKREAYIASLDDDDRSAYMQHFAEEEERQRFYQEAIAKDLETTKEDLEKQKHQDEEVVQKEALQDPDSKHFSQMHETGFRSAEDQFLWENSYMHPEHGRMNRHTGEPWQDGDFEKLQAMNKQDDAKRDEFLVSLEDDVRHEQSKHEREEDLNFALDDVELHEEREENLNFALDDVEAVQKEYLVRGELKELDEMALNPNEGKPMPSVLIDDTRLYGHETVDDFKRAGAEVGNVVGYDGYSKVDILEKTQEKDEPKAQSKNDNVLIYEAAAMEREQVAQMNPDERSGYLEMAYENRSYRDELEEEWREEARRDAEWERDNPPYYDDEPEPAPELDDIPFDDPAFEKAYFATQEAEPEQEQEQEIERDVPEWYSEMCEEQSMAWMEEVIPDQEYHSPGYELEEEPTLTR